MLVKPSQFRNQNNLKTRKTNLLVKRQDHPHQRLLSVHKQKHLLRAASPQIPKTSQERSLLMLPFKINQKIQGNLLKQQLSLLLSGSLCQLIRSHLLSSGIITRITLLGLMLKVWVKTKTRSSRWELNARNKLWRSWFQLYIHLAIDRPLLTSKMWDNLTTETIGTTAETMSSTHPESTTLNLATVKATQAEILFIVVRDSAQVMSLSQHLEEDQSRSKKERMTLCRIICLVTVLITLMARHNTSTRAILRSISLAKHRGLQAIEASAKKATATEARR